MDSSSMWFIVLNVLAIATLCLCLAILICNYKKQYPLSLEQKIWQNSLAYGVMVLVICIYTIFHWTSDIMKAIDLLLRVIPIIMAAIAFIIAFLNFKRKVGVDIDCISHTVVSSNEGMFLKKISILNNKDRPLLIFGLYLEVDKKYLIELDTEGDASIDYNHQNPIIIKPYEIAQIEFSKKQYYVDGQQAHLNFKSPLLIFHKEKLRIGIRTADYSISYFPLVKRNYYPFKKNSHDLNFDKDKMPKEEITIQLHSYRSSDKIITLSVKDNKIVELETLKE